MALHCYRRWSQGCGAQPRGDQHLMIMSLGNYHQISSSSVVITKDILKDCLWWLIEQCITMQWCNVEIIVNDITMNNFSPGLVMT